MHKMIRPAFGAGVFAALGAAAWWVAAQPAADPAPAAPAAAVVPVPGMPGVPDRNNLYSETGAGRLGPAVAGALVRVYVPNRAANSVSVIDPETLKVIDTYKVGVNPQHIVPSWDLRTLWVAATTPRGRTDGSLTPIDPADRQARQARSPVDDPYNMYWTPGRQGGDRRRRGLQAA